MDAVREAWTDERLDDLAHRMDRGFERTDAEVRELRREMNERFVAADTSMNARFDASDISANARFDASDTSMNARFDASDISANARFDALNARFDSLNRNLIIALVTIVGAFIGSTFT